MGLKRMVILSGFAIGILAFAQIVLAQEAAVAPVDSEVITSDQQASLPKDSDMQWAWGEVTHLDDQSKTVNLKYLDYETDQEKELVLVVDEKTTFENIKDFNELKLNDTLSIDYMLGADNKNIAKNISFERPEASSALTPAQESGQQPVILPSGIEQSVADAAQPATPVEPAPVVQGQAQ
jgi:hypothetical protein